MKKTVTLFILTAMIACSGGGKTEKRIETIDTLSTDIPVVEPISNEEIEETKSVDSYAYYTKDEILSKMEKAVKAMKSPGTNSAIKETYLKLIVADIGNSQNTIEDKWGSPLKKDIEEFPDDDEPGPSKSIQSTYPMFEINLDFFPEEWLIQRIVTKTPGFGFGGLYIGVPECNKAFVEKLFSGLPDGSIRKNPKAEDQPEYWSITLYIEDNTSISLRFEEDGTISQIWYESQNYVY